MKAMTVFPGKLGNPAAHTAAWGSATFRSLPLCFSTEEPVSRDPLLSEVGGQEIGSIGANFQVAAGWIFRPASSGHPIAGPAYGVKGWKCSLHLELEARGWGRSGCRAPLRNVRAYVCERVYAHVFTGQSHPADHPSVPVSLPLRA